MTRAQSAQQLWWWSGSAGADGHQWGDWGREWSWGWCWGGAVGDGVGGGVGHGQHSTAKIDPSAKPTESFDEDYGKD